MSNAEAAHAAFASQEGVDGGPGEWFEVTQEQINQFADATLDHQFIHIDPEAAAATPFGGTIAHGFLTLSMLSHLTTSIPQDLPHLDGMLMGINYGFDKVRFVAPVPSGSRIRATSVLAKRALKGTSLDLTRTVTVEVEGGDKPAIVADWITRIVFDS